VRWYTVTGKPDRMRRRGYPWDPSILVKEGEHVPAGALTETVDHKKVKEGNLVCFSFFCDCFLFILVTGSFTYFTRICGDLKCCCFRPYCTGGNYQSAERAKHILAVRDVAQATL
jgi:hypothetical protein